MKETLLVLLIFTMSLTVAEAQDDRTDRLGIGVGPAMMYGDNTGITRQFKFKVLPALTLDYHKKLHAFWDARASLGWQMVSSGDFYDHRHLPKIARNNLPHGFKGNAFYADVMPVFHLNPNQSGYLPAMYKVYVGTGFGLAYVSRQDRYLSIIGEDIYGEEILGDARTIKGSNTSVYMPFRLGVTKDINEPWEIGLESSLLVSFFGELDGNDLQQKVIKPDILAQFQFFIRRRLDL
ncbi:MAG TPA: hypothetical protein VK014_09460 [Cyclobacteriaceae bacterium]|nr:hypothetical protein [Cyclobacteriaceae bacterium]